MEQCYSNDVHDDDIFKIKPMTLLDLRNRIFKHEQLETITTLL